MLLSLCMQLSLPGMPDPAHVQGDRLLLVVRARIAASYPMSTACPVSPFLSRGLSLYTNVSELSPVWFLDGILVFSLAIREHPDQKQAGEARVCLYCGLQFQRGCCPSWGRRGGSRSVSLTWHSKQRSSFTHTQEVRPGYTDFKACP